MSETTFHISSERTLSVEASATEDLACRPYIEWRLVERDRWTGDFVGFHAFGSRAFVESALTERLRIAYGVAA